MFFVFPWGLHEVTTPSLANVLRKQHPDGDGMVFKEPSRKVKILLFLVYELWTLLIYSMGNAFSYTDFFPSPFLGAVWNSWQVSVSF